MKNNFERKTLAEGVFFNAIHETKFKSNLISVRFIAPLNEATAAKNALLFPVLLRGSEKFPDIGSIRREEESIYDTDISDSVYKRGDAQILELLTDCVAATEEDFGREYLDYILSLKTVADVTEAVDHINQYNTKHSDCIITENEAVAVQFLNQVDAACVYWNASTRFTDGFEFGFGAEIGISTQKLHARGPMGLKELTSYKYLVKGCGQTR
jgi:glutamate-5-semialdehyde dehydrogenase